MEDISARYPNPGDDVSLTKYPKLSQDYIKSVVEEIRTWHDQPIHHIEHLYLMPVECYSVKFEDDYTLVFVRDEEGHLKTASGWSYDAIHDFADMHYQTKGDQNTESPQEPLP